MQTPEGKEVKIMRYEKPEVVVLGSAVNAIQSSDKPRDDIQDSGTDTYFSVSAYEADE
jgi:hypothetical protein